MRAARRFLTGAASVPRAFSVVARNPKLWAWIVAPACAAVLVSVAVVWSSYRWGSAFVTAHVAGQGTLVTAASWLLFWLTLIGACIACYFATSAIVTAPFSSFISERAERITTGTIVRAPASFAEGMRGLGHTIFLAIIYLASEGILVALEVVIEPLAPLWIALGLACSALFLAYDHLDGPLSRRGMSTSAKWAYIHAHLAESLGFGAAAALLALVPGLGLAVPAIAAAGGTLLCLELERADQSSAIAPS